MTREHTGWRANPFSALTVLSLGLFMTLVDVTIVNVAMPQLLESLGASIDQALWILNAYVLVLGVSLITAGRLGDVYGPRTMYVAGTAVFTVASAACGLAGSPGALIAARAVQGIGAAMLLPQPLAIVLPLFPPERRGVAFSINGVVAGIAAIAGPTVGGLIVTHADWRWIFFVNVPVGVLAIVLALWIVPDLRPGTRHRLDIAGVVTATAGLTAISFALIEGQRYAWGQVWGVVSIPALLIAGVALLGLFGWLQKRRQTGDREPLVPFELFRNRNYTLMIVVGAALQLGMSGLLLPFTIYMQSVLELSALEAGVVYVPFTLVSLVLVPFVGRLTDRIGGKYILMSGLALFATGSLVLAATAGVATSRWALLPGVLIAGVGVSGIFVPMLTVAMGEVPSRLAGAASGLINTTRQLGGAFGAALVGALLQYRLAASLHDQAAERAGAVPPAARGGFVEGFSDAGSRGLEVGTGQTGGLVELPRGTPAGIVDQVGAVAHAVFDYAFVSAMRWTLVLPALVLFAASASCLLLRQAPRPGPQPTAAETAGVA